MGPLLAGWWRDRMARRPTWMNLLLVFCVFMALVYVPWDFFVKPVASDEEVWFGVRLHGWLAKATEPLRWWIYAALAYGFWRMRRWMWPWAGIYFAQVAVAMLVWSVLYVDARWSVVRGSVIALPFAALAVALFRTRPLFQSSAKLIERYPGWALVTGASAGIGAELARQLAASGFSCALTARREDRLRTLASELERAHGVQTRVISADLATIDGAARVANAVADLELSVLVNNAGFGYAGRFEGQDADRLRDMVLLNCLAPTLLTSLLLPQLRRRPRAAILFVGSVAAQQPLPLHATYAATKAYLRLLGEALWAELRDRSVDVLVLEPASTESEFHDRAGELPHHGVPAAVVVREALDSLAHGPSLIPGWKPWLRGNAGMRLLPRSWLSLAALAFTAQQTPEERR